MQVKRMLAILFMLAVVLGACAQAEVSHWPWDQGERMMVVNCDEWVSLRARPDAGSERLAQVPLYDALYNCRAAENGFTLCETADGVEGYVLSEYLAPVAFELRGAGEAAAGGDVWDAPARFGADGWTLEFPERGMRVLCAREWDDGGEKLRASCFDAAGGFVWGLYTATPLVTELNSTNVFAGGTAEQPRLLAYNASLGLAAIDLASGAPAWVLNAETAQLGAGQTAAVAADGTIYVGGFYGPDPVAISADGKVLWRSSVDGNTYWLSEIRVEGGEIAASYDAEDGYSHVWFDRATGAVTRAE